MRRMLALAALTLAVIGTVGSPTCDSGCVARAQDRPARDLDRPKVIPGQDKRRTSQPVDYSYPPPLDDRQRGPVRGDFWRPGELYNLMGRPNDGFSR